MLAPPARCVVLFNDMKGVILINPYDTYYAQRHKVERMTEEFDRLGVDVTVLRNDQFVAYVENGKSVRSFNADFVLFFDKDRYTSELLEKCGARVYNSAEATAICDDKMLTHVALANNSIPMPKTLPGALCYNPNGEISDEYVTRAVELLGLPVVVKECHGSYGEQVYLAETIAELKAKIAEIKTKAYLLQQFESNSCGKDARVIVIGGKYVCSMLRINERDFRSNVGLGGKGVKVELPEHVVQTCERVANILHLDYCGIDVLLGDTPKVCEVNSNAMFEEMERVTGVNVAGKYAEFIVRNTKLHK